jgi:UDP-N-acetylglucosamine--dolichyl-phosphate N-acetylglucosaminephosphotransferase
MTDYNAAILSISLMTLLGFVDDVLELRWRYKLIIPCVATLPLVQVYRAQHQSTTIALPAYFFFILYLIFSFFGSILGQSTNNLTFFGKIVSIFAEVSGNPYGTAINLRNYSFLLIISRLVVLHLHSDDVYLLYQQY